MTERVADVYDRLFGPIVHHMLMAETPICKMAPRLAARMVELNVETMAKRVEDLRGKLVCVECHTRFASAVEAHTGRVIEYAENVS